MNQNIDIWSLGCIYSEAVRWIPQKHTGLVAYRERRMAEIDRIHAFDGVDCFHNGRTVLEAVHESNEIAIDRLLRKDFITDKAIEMINDMLVSAETRPSAHWLWVKQLRILEAARRKLKPPDSSASYPSASQRSDTQPQRRPSPQLRHTLPASGLSMSPPLPPVLPKEYGPEANRRRANDLAQWASPYPTNTHVYDDSPLLIESEGGIQRRSPDSLTEDHEASSPSSHVRVSQTISPHISPVPSAHQHSQHTSPVHPAQQKSPYARSNYQQHNQQNLENVGDDYSGGPSTILRQGSRNDPRGTSQVFRFSNPRYSPPAPSISQNRAWSPDQQQQRQGLPSRRAPTNRGLDYTAHSATFHDIADPFVYENNVQQNTYSSRNFPTDFSSPATSPLVPGAHEPNNNQATSFHNSPRQKQPRQPRPGPVVIQNSETAHMSLQEALDWRNKCKETRTDARGLDRDLLNRLKDRDHVSRGYRE